MGIVFADQWLSNGADHVKSRATAEALIRSAATALGATQHMEVKNWVLAVTHAAPGDGVNKFQGPFLRVFKDAHQKEGVFGQYVHLTISLKLQKASGEYPHASYGGAFHLYVEIIDPVVGQAKFNLQPKMLSYADPDKVIVDHVIPNAAMVGSDK